MKQAKIATILFILIVASVSYRCNEDAVTKTKSDLLTQHTWIIISGTPPEHAIVKVAIEAGIEYSFKADGTFIAIDHRFDEPATGVWEFNDDQTKLITDKGTDYETTSDISKLDDSNLEFTSISGGQTVTILFKPK